MMFAVLFGVCVILVRTGVGSTSGSRGAWLAEGRGQVEVALALLPFAGIFFLWFIAVSRQRLGRYEDRFISTLVLGSGLLFVVGVQAWALLIFPVWVFLVSAYLLAITVRGGVDEAGGAEAVGPDGRRQRSVRRRSASPAAASTVCRRTAADVLPTRRLTTTQHA